MVTPGKTDTMSRFKKVMSQMITLISEEVPGEDNTDNTASNDEQD